MTKMFSLLAVALLILPACSTMTPPRYSVSTDNVMALKKYKNKKVQMLNLKDPARASLNCRLMGPIEPADGLSVGQFIEKAFNDEFKMADIYSDNGRRTLSGEVSKITFSSIKGLTNGFWDIGITVQSNNGRSISVENRYEFKSGFDAITACNATADALSPAVQDLINKVVTDPRFPSLL